MKKPSDDLFSLIKSLNPSEKGYFKKYASIHNTLGDNNYLKLYEIINKSETYNEEEIKEVYKNEKFVNHLWVIKKYLYETLLKSLQEYHSDSLIETQLNEIYNNIQVLYKKGLFKQCIKYVEKGKRICEENELYTFLPKFLIMERKLFNSVHYSDKSDIDIDKLYKEINLSINKLNNFNDYQYYSSKLFLLIRNIGSAKGESDFKELDAILKKPLYKSEKNALTTESKLLFYTVHYFYNYLKRNLEKCYYHSEKLVKIYEASPLKIKNRPKTFLQYINNHLEVCVATNRFTDFISYLNKYREICNMVDDTNKTLLITSYSHELNYYLKSGKYKEGLAFIAQIEPQLSEASGKANEIISCYIYYSSAYLYFLTDDHSEALNYLNKILHNRSLGEENDILFYSRILNLIIHFEMGNIALIEYILKSTFRKLSKQKQIHKFEKIIYTFLRKAFSLNNDIALKTSFAELRSRLKEISKDPFENGAFDYIDIISWLESKMTGKSFAEVVKGKLGIMSQKAYTKSRASKTKTRSAVL